MKRVLPVAALTAAVSFLMAAGAFAGTQDGSVFALHAKAHTVKSTTLCTTWKPTIPCSQYNTTWPLNTNADVYLVIAKVPNETLGIAGVSCGIDYDNALGSGVDVFGWTLCADLEFTNGNLSGCPPDLPPCEWPIAGGGNRITWVSTTNCQRTVIAPDGVHAIAGVFYLYAYGMDLFMLTENRNLQIPELAVADCNASTTYLPWYYGAHVGWVGFGQPGCNPCIDYYCGWGPIEAATWGQVKTRY